MRFILQPVLFGLCFAPAVFPSDLHLTAKSNGQTTIKVGPGATVPYTIFGELSDAQNEGLALFCFDLSYSGGALAPASSPTSGPMANFAVPLGINNPSGFGGFVSAGILRQVGGGQNTINNAFAPFPSGTVLTGIAQAGAQTALVSGNLTAPYIVGVSTLTPSNLVANVIRLGETGVPFWRVDAAQPGTIGSLSVEVEALSSNVSSCSVSAQQSQTLSLDAGPANAGRTYQVLGSITGTVPGTSVGGGLVIPLNNDRYFKFTLFNPNNQWLPNSLGILDGQGRATVLFTPTNRLVGLNFHHAFMLLNPVDFVSNPAPCSVLP